MPSFTTEISLPAGKLPIGYIRHVTAASGDVYGPDDPVDNITIEVTYEPGWHTPGRYHGPPDQCYEDEGEDPEILSVTIDDEDYEGEALVEIDDLDREDLIHLANEAWEHQNEPRDWDD